jgi:phosphatidylglycerophosphatase C
MKKETIIIFDFDGTITKNDTMFHMAKWHFGTVRFCFKMLKIMPYCFLYKSGFISNVKAKEAFLRQFYADMDYNEFATLCKNYSLLVIDTIIKKEVQNKIKFYKSQSNKIIIITASILEWVEPWALKNGFDKVLSSKIEVVNNKLTGKIAGKNCYGLEKVNRFISEYGPFENYHTICFGDSRGDLEILKKSNEYYYKKYE